VLVTAGGAPPREPVKVWTLAPDAAAPLAAGEAAEDALLAAGVAEEEELEAAELAEEETPRAELKASAAAWPVALAAAVSAEVQAALVAALALQEEES